MTRETPRTVPASLAAVGLAAETRIMELLNAEVNRWGEINPMLVEPIDSLRRLVMAGGKRLRPAFCHWAYIGAGGIHSNQLVVDAGAALELLHTFALVHDDVMDGSDMRRGQPSVHRHLINMHAEAGWNGEGRRFGEGAAIIIGDFAFVYADQLMADVPPPARAIFDELRLELCVGQYLDMLGTAGSDRSTPAARTIEIYKSGKYTVERPLHLGAALAGKLDELAEPLSAFGLPLGEAFQIRDDLLGVFGDSAVTGKPVGDDLREGKLTPLVAEAAARSTGSDLALLERIGSTDLDDAAISDLCELFIRSGSVDAMEAEIKRLVAESFDALDRAPLEQGARHALTELAKFVAWRDR